MGVTWFQLKSVKFSEPVIAFSSNYALYASMSNRVMVHLEALAPRVEQYFIDEMFLDIRGIDSCIDLGDFGRQLREHVRSGTGLTIGVGMGPTKTLAKSAVQKNCCHCSRWRKSGGGRPQDLKEAEHNGDHHSTAAGPGESDFHQEKFQCGSGENGPGTQWRKLYFTGGSTAPQTADSRKRLI
ncbi:nucleotidyltransferase [Salmonella enterica subsp. enterica]|nr:nucleotidyltransferase [Salmonella enterica subsp. enterica serovar Javiana]EED2931359.1 nucleotidyltransferase [Salmonella enterica subsp. enterica serovar Javiana]